MRIISGQKKGERLFSLKKIKIRPTSDKVKGAIFNILSSGTEPGEFVEGKKVLDLFAGSGALGIEALSRGAFDVVFVDNSSASLNLIRKNLEKLGLKDKSRIIKKDILRFLKGEFREKFDLVFADPPYGKGLCQEVLGILAKRDILNMDGVLVIEHYRKENLGENENFRLLLERKYGVTLVSFFKKKSYNDKKELL